MRTNKVLVTGATGMATRPQEVVAGKAVYSAIPLFVDMLKFLGYEVDHRKTEIGEDLSGYDKIFVQIGSFGSFVTSNLKWSAFYALALYPEKSWLLIDDWQVDGVVPPHTDDGLFKCDHLSPQDFDEYMKLRKGGYFKPVSEYFRSARLEGYERVIYPAFEWGDPEVLRQTVKFKRAVTFDPSAFAPRLTPKTHRLAHPSEREKAWVWTQLGPAKLKGVTDNMTWPLQLLHRGESKDARPKRQEERIVRELYSKYVGVISPPQPKIFGLGWWRQRVRYAIEAGAILWMDERECSALPRASIEEIENMSDVQLGALCNHQYSVFSMKSPDMVKATGCLQAALSV